MNETPISSFEHAIRATYSCRSHFRDKATVREEFKGKTVWEGKVLIFDLLDHPTASHCYAWEVDGRITAVLHEGPIDSPEAAVRAAIVAEYQSKS